MSENYAIGLNNSLPWHLSDDLKRFKEITTGHQIVMGRKTYESIGVPLPNRVNFVLTRNSDLKIDGVHVISSLNDIPDSDKKTFIIGGGEIYDQSMSIADEIELTRVHADFDADTFFPEINPHQWKEVWREEHPADEKHPHSFTFLRYQKI